MSNTGRSVAAVIAGAIVGIVLTLCTDFIMHGTGIFPASGQSMSNGLFALATAYRTVFGVLGAWVTARLAPSRPMKHAIVLGLIGFVVSLAGVVVSLNKPEMGPLWYPIALVVLALPQSWLGGRLREMQLS